MAQIKLELEKEIYIPHKVIIKMEEEPHHNNLCNQWNAEDYYTQQHWKSKEH